MKKIYTSLLIGIALISLTACQGDGEFYGHSPYINSPYANSKDVSASSITVSGMTDPFMLADNIDMDEATEIYTGGSYETTISNLRPNSFYYVANIKTDEFGSKYISYPSAIQTKDYDDKVLLVSNTQVTFSMGTVDYDKMLIADNSNMSGAIEAELHDDAEHSAKELSCTRPNTTYYWLTEATDYRGITYHSPVNSFTTKDWDMYLEYITTTEMMFNAGSVYYTKWSISDKADMSNILATQTSKRFRVWGMTPNTTYYYQTEATDIFGLVYKSPIFSFKTLDYGVETLEPEVTSTTACLKAKINGNSTGHSFTVRFEVNRNGSYYHAFNAQYDAQTDTYYCDIAVMNNNSSYSVTAETIENYKTYSTGKSIDFTLDTHHSAEAIDMGLSVKWASWNVGARKPEEYGGLYYYGDTEAATAIGEWKNQYNISGTYNDIARRTWGGSWRMPTYDEFKELSDNCSVANETLNGVAGYRLTSNINSNSIFIPCAGIRANYSLEVTGRGTTTELYSGTASDYYRWVEDKYGSTHYGLYQVWYFYFSGTYLSSSIGINNYQIGRSIRPVCP